MSRLPALFGEGRARGIAGVAALAVGQAVAAGIAAFATRDVFDAFSGAAPLPFGSLALIIAAGVIIAALRVAERTLSESVGQDYAAALRKTLFTHVSRMPAGEISRRRVGALAIRFVGDLSAVRSWVSLGVARLISASIVLPGALAALVLLNPNLAAAAAAPLALAIVLMALLAPRLAPLHRRLRGTRTRLAADMSERIPVAPELRLLGRHVKEINRLDRSARALREAAVDRAWTSAALRALPELGAALAGVSLLWTALSTHAAAAEAAGALAALGILTLPLRDLASIWDRRRAWEVARDKCLGVLHAPVLETMAAGKIPSMTEPACLAFEGAGAGTLRDIRASAAPGQKVSIVGGNGAGKSTLLALAAGLEHAPVGRVSLDGSDIRAVSLDQRRATVAYLGPRSPILKGSLRRALTLGIDPRPEDALIEAAARDFGLDGVIHRLGGLDGKLCEAGRNLSSGETRRLHLVRAWLARPRLLLLDEPDDALDIAGRELVAKLMRETPATTLIVTHDLVLARRSDMLWYLEAGRLLEHGPPELLLSHDGPTRRFFRPNRVA